MFQLRSNLSLAFCLIQGLVPVVATLSSYPVATVAMRRHLTGLFQKQTWNHDPFPCLYAGDRQGGPIFEVAYPNDPVIEEGYKDYVNPGVFSEKDYKFGLFDDSKCSDKSL